MRNNWRIKKTTQAAVGHKYRLTDILWWTRPQDVLSEIASMLNLRSVTTSNIEWFTHRTKASKKMLENMTEEEMTKIKDEAEKYQVEGLPSEVRRK